MISRKKLWSWSSSFSSVNGKEQLERYFADVEAREAEGVVIFPTPESMRAYVAANITRAHLAASVPAFTEPIRARTRSHRTITTRQLRCRARIPILDKIRTRCEHNCKAWAYTQRQLGRLP